MFTNVGPAAVSEQRRINFMLITMLEDAADGPAAEGKTVDRKLLEAAASAEAETWRGWDFLAVNIATVVLAFVLPMTVLFVNVAPSDIFELPGKALISMSIALVVCIGLMAVVDSFSERRGIGPIGEVALNAGTYLLVSTVGLLIDYPASIDVVRLIPGGLSVDNIAISTAVVVIAGIWLYVQLVWVAGATIVGFIANRGEAKAGREVAVIHLLAAASALGSGSVVGIRRRNVAVERLETAGRAIRFGLPRAARFGSKRMNAEYREYCDSLARAVEAHIYRIHSPQAEEWVQVRRNILRDARSLVRGFDGDILVAATRSSRAPFWKRCLEFSRTIGVGLLPAVMLWGAPQFGISIPSTFLATAVPAVAIWAIAALLIAIDPRVTGRIQAAQGISGLLKPGGKGE